MQALVATGTDEVGTFRTLAKFIREGDQRSAAIRALSRIPNNRWPHQELMPLINSVIGYVGKLP